jgi:hypothetical protein
MTLQDFLSVRLMNRPAPVLCQPFREVVLALRTAGQERFLTLSVAESSTTGYADAVHAQTFSTSFFINLAIFLSFMSFIQDSGGM